MIIHYLPIFALDLETGVRTNVLTGETAQVEVKTELERAKQWYEKQFYYNPHHSPQYQAIISHLSKSATGNQSGSSVGLTLAHNQSLTKGVTK